MPTVQAGAGGEKAGEPGLNKYEPDIVSVFLNWVFDNIIFF